MLQILPMAPAQVGSLYQTKEITKAVYNILWIQ